MKEIKLFLLLKGRMYREIIREYLESFDNIEVVSDADNLKVVSNMYKFLPPEIIFVVDEKIDGFDGIGNASEFLERHPKAKVIVLYSGEISEDLIEFMKEKGFTGCLSMTMNYGQMKEAIERAYYESVAVPEPVL